MSKQSIILATVTCTLLLSAIAWAAGNAHTVGQKNKKFSTSEVTAKVGDRLVIQNNDTVTHSLFTKDAGYKINEAQKPGKESTFELDKPGEITVRCAIHPTMVMKVKIEEQ